MVGASLGVVLSSVAKKAVGKEISLHKNVFDNGLTSLELLILITEFEKEAGVSVSIEELYQAGTFSRYFEVYGGSHD